MKSSKKKTVILSSAAFLGALIPAPVLAGMTSPCFNSLIAISAPTTTVAFGNADPCTATSGALVLTKNGTLNTTGCILSTYGTPALGGVKITPGQATWKAKVQVKIATGTFTLTDTADTPTIQGSSFEMGGKQTVTVDGTGSTTLVVHGKVNVGGGQAGGTYQGTFKITALCK